MKLAAEKGLPTCQISNGVNRTVLYESEMTFTSRCSKLTKRAVGTTRHERWQRRHELQATDRRHLAAWN